MKYTYLWTFFILLGMLVLGILMLFGNVAINNESEYYVLKESVEAAMYESIDWEYYAKADVKDIKIVEEKSVANCTRRFYTSISGFGKGYELTFYDIMESPPKVSVLATSKTDDYMFLSWGDGNEDNQTSFDINNALSAVLEYYSNDGDEYDK